MLTELSFQLQCKTQDSIIWKGRQDCVHLPDEHLAHALRLWEQVPHFTVHLIVDDERVAGPPVSHLHGLAGRHHVLPHALWGPWGKTKHKHSWRFVKRS